MEVMEKYKSRRDWMILRDVKLVVQEVEQLILVESESIQ